MVKHNINIKLTGGSNANSVTRIGNTVNRSLSPNHRFVHKLLLHLEHNGFHAAPRFLGISSNNEEILSYIEGEVPRGIELSDNHILTGIRMLRRMHDIASLSSLCGTEETICHNDFAPWNIIFKDNKIIGVIDFDDSQPGRRIDDVAYCLWTFLDLGNPKISDVSQLTRMAKLCQDYQLDDWTELPVAVLRQQKRILEYREAIVRLEKDQLKRDFAKKAIVRIKSDMDWIISKHNKIEEALKKVMH